jgi:maltose O-acetyltransferase
VTIGQGCIVGAGSVVAGDLPDYTVAVGNPAKVIRERTR